MSGLEFVIQSNIAPSDRNSAYEDSWVSSSSLEIYLFLCVSTIFSSQSRHEQSESNLIPFFTQYHSLSFLRIILVFVNSIMHGVTSIPNTHTIQFLFMGL